MSPENGNGAGSSNGMVIASPAMRSIFRLLPKAAKSNASVLVQGESGTGKELIAKEIHDQSERKGPFVSVNCAAIPADLLESILFGHKRGSFTGAIADRRGLMQSAANGSFFLDEVGEMPLTTQVKLLRALQEKEVLPVGDTTPVSINCRIIASTNCDLEQRIEAERFRPDLLYRLNVIDLNLPPLRERVEDIPLLIDHFLRKFSDERPPTVSSEAMFMLMKYGWPGNIRQLENVIERAVVLNEDCELGSDDLPSQIVTGTTAVGTRNGTEPPVTLKEAQRRYTLMVYRMTGDNQYRTADILGITRPTLRNRLRQYGVLPWKTGLESNGGSVQPGGLTSTPLRSSQPRVV